MFPELSTEEKYSVFEPGNIITTFSNREYIILVSIHKFYALDVVFQRCFDLDWLLSNEEIAEISRVDEYGTRIFIWRADITQHGIRT